MFDRSGECYSHPFDFHANPVDFIRLILTVSSPDCAAVGFDTRIYWEGNCRKFRTLDANQNPVVYSISDNKGRAYFARDSIRGRGTCCWKVKDAEGNEYIMKDQWVSLGRHPEHEFFSQIGATPGVAEMISFQIGPSVSKLRGIEDYANLGKQCYKLYFKDRTLNTVTFKYGGRPIYEFRTRGEVLFALRDAIKGV